MYISCFASTNNVFVHWMNKAILIKRVVGNDGIIMGTGELMSKPRDDIGGVSLFTSLAKMLSSAYFDTGGEETSWRLPLCSFL